MNTVDSAQYTQFLHGRGASLLALMLSATLPLLPLTAFGQEVRPQHEHGALQANPSLPLPQTQTPSAVLQSQGMGQMDMGAQPAQPVSKMLVQSNAKPNKATPMGAMQGGRAPANARDPDAYSDGYDYGTMPGMEQADKIRTNIFLGDQLEFTHGRGGSGFAWDIRHAYGPDEWKFLIRAEGAVVGNKVDFTTGAEALWWTPLNAFWGTTLGVHQDFGPGSHTSLAFGVEGLAPYWVQLEATGFVDETGRFSARLKGFYDVLLTNRLILTPEVQTNLFSRANVQRGVGAGFSNIELSARLRYEFSRNFAPYVGFVWDRALGASVGQRMREGEPINDGKFVVGLRVLW